jgi:hypothetical protein
MFLVIVNTCVLELIFVFSEWKLARSCYSISFVFFFSEQMVQKNAESNYTTEKEQMKDRTNRVRKTGDALRMVKVTWDSL